jgi:hypothetical protein
MCVSLVDGFVSNPSPTLRDGTNTLFIGIDAPRTIPQHARIVHKRRDRVSALIISARNQKENNFFDDVDDFNGYDGDFVRSVGESQEERDLQSVARRSDVTYEDDSPVRYSVRRKDVYYDEEYDSYEDYGDEIDGREEEDRQAPGNFWSNPVGSLDRSAPPRRPPKRSGSPDNLSSTRPIRNPARKTPVRTGPPGPPPPVRDLYNRLFWYGFDPAETSTNADRTMFGGTKGKFNGLMYLEDGVGAMPKERRRRTPRNYDDSVLSGSDDYFYDDDDRDEDRDQVDLYEDFKGKSQDEERKRPLSTKGISPNVSSVPKVAETLRTSVTPPYDPPRPMPSRPTRIRNLQPTSRPSRRRRDRPRDQYGDTDIDSSWFDGDSVSSKVSNWFTNEEDEFVEYDRQNRKAEHRRPNRRQDDSIWSPFNALDTFLGLNRDRLGEKADAYNRQMGIPMESEDEDQPYSPIDNKLYNPRPRRRKGYAYQYNDEEDQSGVNVYTVLDDDENEYGTWVKNDVIDAVVQPIPEAAKKSVIDNEPGTKRNLSWGKRALAVERVPPTGIPAWGPTGDLGMDARAKAISDALEDILEAKNKVSKKEELVMKAREDVSILRIDTELERKRLRKSRLDPRLIQDTVRKLDLKVDDAARSLRYAQAQLKKAKDELSDLEARHWAVLGCYDSDQVEANIMAAMQELEETEPAVRRILEKKDVESNPRNEALRENEVTSEQAKLNFVEMNEDAQ